jgi:hypothetical protein
MILSLSRETLPSHLGPVVIYECDCRNLNQRRESGDRGKMQTGRRDLLIGWWQMKGGKNHTVTAASNGGQENSSVKNTGSWTLVAHTCNPSHSGGRDQEDCSSKSALSNSSTRPYLEKPFTLTKKIRLVEWFKVKAMSSSPSTVKKKKRSQDQALRLLVQRQRLGR